MEQVALVHGIVMGGGGAMVAPSKFSVVTENAVCFFTSYTILIGKFEFS
jgi:enoyl-CoA hydratase/carnithine racemase